MNHIILDFQEEKHMVNCTAGMNRVPYGFSNSWL